MTKRFGVSGQALLAGMVGAGAMAAFTLVPQLMQPADARQISNESPNGAPLSFAERVWVMYWSICKCRFKFYAAWLISEAAMTLGGWGYNPKTGEW